MNFTEYVINKANNIWRYIEYKASQDDVSLDEAARRSLSRAWQLSNDPSVNIAIITAFRGENDLPTNLSRNVQLSLDIRQAGYGFIPVAGGFVERIRDGQGKETGEEQKVEENSFFISSQDPPEQFKKTILELVNKYNQEAALVRYVGEEDAHLLNANGSQFKVGKWAIDKLADYYTRMVKGPPDREFVFEAAGDDSVMTQYAVKKFLESKDK